MARPRPLICKNEYLVLALGEEIAAEGSSWLYRLGVSQAQKAKDSEDELPRLSAS